MKKLRIAVIDLGTNSVRFDIHQVDAKRRTRLLHREKLMVRLGENVFLQGQLDARAMRRTLQAFVRFKRVAEQLNTDQIVAFGTSTLREARDSENLLRSIKAQTGIDVRVISGDDEAKLIASAVLAHEREIKGNVALLDIGGGSTEISICVDRKVLHGHSFALGAARLQQIFLRDVRSTRSKAAIDAIATMRRHVRSVLLSKIISEEWPKVDRIIGSSGTIKALSRILRKESGSKYITREALRKLVKNMSTMTLDELRQLPGLELKRVDLILAGAVLLEECMDALEAKKVKFTAFSLRDGIVRQELRALPEAPPSSQMDVVSLYAKACQFGCQEANLRQLVMDAEMLFNRLQSLHKLEARWRTYLTLAVIFRDVGWAISPVNHEMHSYYIVKNVELPLAERWEREFVAQLCLRHEGGKLDLEELPFKGEGSEAKREGFQKLLALLRIVDALDPAHKKRISAEGVRIRPGAIHLVLSRGNSVELAMLRIQQKKALFEKVFSRPLTAEAV